jgi:hypothetical protein
MSRLWSAIKRIILWSYGRTSWQYDVLCVLILAFIFLTPKTWFDEGELDRGQMHQRSDKAVRKLLISSENLGQNPDPQAVERDVQKITGRSDLRVRGWRVLRADDGSVAAYEVDIH